MARKPRAEVDVGICHVYSRGNERQTIFRDVADRHIYLRLLGNTVLRQRWYCLAFCLMPNHVHLLIETTTPNLGEGMRRLHGVYAQRFNRRHDRVGHLFQGRYGVVNVADDAQLATTLGYIAANPVAAELVANAEDWRWGSHLALVGHEPVPPWLGAERLDALLEGAFGGDGRERYRELVDERLALTTGVAVTASEVTAGAGNGSSVL